MALPGLPPAPELEALGVRRLSAGIAIAQAVFGKASAMAAAFLRDGVSHPKAEGTMTYPQLNTLMTGR
jgi:2-methylisocitrate lyase-like PEP mutase family enzyme